jgi:hypothetical protein
MRLIRREGLVRAPRGLLLVRHIASARRIVGSALGLLDLLLVCCAGMAIGIDVGVDQAGDQNAGKNRDR